MKQLVYTYNSPPFENKELKMHQEMMKLRDLLYKVQPFQFSLGNQQDAAEVMQILLNTLGMNKIRLTKEFSYPISPLNHEKEDSNTILSLPLSGSSLKACFDKFFATEAGDGKLEVGDQKVPFSHQLFLKGPLPKVIPVQLMRFGWDVEGPVKFQESIQLNQIDLSPYLKRPTRYSSLYNVVAVVNQMGFSISAGHYSAFVNKADRSLICDDESITPLDEDPGLGYIFILEKA